MVSSASPAATAMLRLSPTPEPLSTPVDKPVRLEKTILESKQGQKWQLEAERLDWSNASEKAKAHEVTWYLLALDGKKSIKVEAKGAEIDLNAQLVSFSGSVLAKRLGSNETFIVQRLVYDGKKRLFKGSQGVRWKRQGLELAGEELTADAELSKVQLKGAVKGQSIGANLKAKESESSGGSY